MSLENQVWFITGVSSGIGRAVAEQALAQGARVVGTLRREDQFAEFEALAPGRALAVKIDITQPEQVEAGVKKAVDEFGRIDVLVNNAGYGLVGALEETSDAEASGVFETNFFGMLRVTRAILPVMRAQRSGRIITLSAIAGFTAFPGFGVYSASKFALEGLTEALAKEVKPLGIGVTLITAGVFRTRFAGNAMQFTENVIEDYGATAGYFRSHISQLDGNQPNDPVKAAKAILEIASVDNPPMRLFLGEDALHWGREKVAQVQGEIDAWESLGGSVKFEEDKAIR
jgi:NAD(P)-dependent dehydrogenase (short-subunit alcohol dehydrogenase family)